MCRFCPTVGRNATGLVKILTTRTAKTRAAEPFDSCVHSYAIVALTTSYIRVVYSCDCGQVLFRSSIVGPVAVGQARRSSEFAVCSRLQTLVDLLESEHIGTCLCQNCPACAQQWLQNMEHLSAVQNMAYSFLHICALFAS